MRGDIQHVLSKVELSSTTASQSSTEIEDSLQVLALPISSRSVGVASSTRSLKRKKSDVSDVSVYSQGYPLMLQDLQPRASADQELTGAPCTTRH